MKKTYVLSLFLLITFYTFLNGQPSFERHYGQPSNFDELAGMAETADGNYLIAGTTANFGAGGFDMLIQKIDTNGDSLWQTTWGDSGNDGANHIISLSTGGFLVSGYTAGSNNDRDLAAVRIDEEGNEVWRFVQGGSKDEEAFCALELPDGRLLVIGLGYQDVSSQRFIQAYYTDSDGNLLGESFAISEGNTNFDLAGCALTSDGGFMVAVFPGYLHKFDDEGVQEWVQELTNPFGIPVEIGRLGRTADGKLRIAGRLVTGELFIAELEEGGTFLNIVEIPNSSFSLINSFASTEDGKLWTTSGAPFGGNPDPFSNFIHLIDPEMGEVVLSTTIQELGLADLTSPYRIYTPVEEQGFLLLGNSRNNDNGENGLVFRADDNAEEDWRRVIGIEGVFDGEFGRLVVETADGGFLMAGTQATLGAERNILLIRTNSNGNVQWSANLGGELNDLITGLEARQDGSYIVSGARNDTLIVAAYSDAGAPLWYREYLTGVNDGTFDLTTNADNEVLLTMPVVENDMSNGFLMKLSAQGDSLWGQYYQSGMGFNATYGITSAADGGYFLGGCRENDVNIIVPWIVKTDANGNEEWSMTYPPGGEAGFTCLITMHQLPDGDVLGNGISIGPFKPFNQRISSGGTLAWQQVLEVEEGSYFSWFSRLSNTMGRLGLFGRKTYPFTSEPLSNESGTITMLDTDGNLIWERDYGREKSGSFRGGAFTSDGGVVAVGTATFDNSDDIWLVKTQADGTVAYSAPLLLPFDLHLAPNPATDWLQLSASGLERGTAQATVYNLNGQQVITEQLPVIDGQLDHNISVRALPAGNYILHLLQGERAMAVKWVKK